MDTNTRESTTRRCSACNRTTPHRGRACLTCGHHEELWPTGPGVAPVDRTNDPWAS